MELGKYAPWCSCPFLFSIIKVFRLTYNTNRSVGNIVWLDGQYHNDNLYEHILEKLIKMIIIPAIFLDFSIAYK